jgi:hypothetical protein
VTPGGAQSIASAQVRRQLRDAAESAGAAFASGIGAAAFVVWDPVRAQVLFCYPPGPADPVNQALTWEPATGRWGRRTLGPIFHARAGRVLDSVNNVNDQRLIGSGADTFLPRRGGLMIDALPRAGQPDQAWLLEKRELDAGDSKVRKFISRVMPRIDGPAGLQVQVQVGVRDAQAGPYSWLPPRTVQVDAAPWAHIEAEGRFIAVRIFGDVTAAQLGPVRCSGFDIEVQPAGWY